MESPKPLLGSQTPLLTLSSALHRHFHRFASDISSKLDAAGKHLALHRLNPPFASLSGKHAFDVALNPADVAKTLTGTAVYTVSNSNNEFVLVSDPNSQKSIGLLCFRQEDAEAFLAQVRTRKKELRSKAKVVPITLDQVYQLKVEGIAFRFLPDPVQIKNALELKASDTKGGFDGVPVFQSDLLVVKKKNKRYCPIYFRKEDIEKELSTISRSSRGAGISQHIMVGSLEDVLKKMEMSEKNSGWDNMIFVPPVLLQTIREDAKKSVYFPISWKNRYRSAELGDYEENKELTCK